MYDELAFPQQLDESGTHPAGLTKLEWFAGMALHGLLANPEAVGSAELCVSDAFNYAEKMCAEAAKRKAGK